MTAQSAIPLKWYVPFATGDSSRVEIPVTSSDATRASQTLGFPPLTMQPPAVGGVPPQGEDFNGAINQIARVAWWTLNGGGWPYDATFATNSNINGYPNGAVLQSADFLGQWINTADNNQVNPDTVGTNWVPGFQYGTTSITGQTGGTTTLTPLQAAKRNITVSGTLASAQTLIMPTWLKDWTITNNTTGAFTLIVKTAAGSGVTIPQNGSPTPVSGDGTNINQAPQNIAVGTSSTHAAQVSQTTGRLLRTSKYLLVTGVQNVSINGGANTTTGATTFTPLSTTTTVKIKAQGGGSGAPGCPSTGSNVSAAVGGAGGAYAEGLYAVAAVSGATVTVGAGGTGGGAGLTAGGNGGASSVGSVVIAPGGNGPAATPAATAPVIAGGGTSSAAPTGGNLISRTGGVGTWGYVPAQNSNGVGGAGGTAGDGGGGPSGGTNAGGASAVNPGAGGAGGTQSAASSGAFAGGAGAAGYVIIEEYA